MRTEKEITTRRSHTSGSARNRRPRQLPRRAIADLKLAEIINMQRLVGVTFCTIENYAL